MRTSIKKRATGTYLGWELLQELLELGCTFPTRIQTRSEVEVGTESLPFVGCRSLLQGKGTSRTTG